MALLVAFLKAIEYRYFIRQVEPDIYMGAFALVFMGLGIWVAWQFMKRREAKEVSAMSPVAAVSDVQSAATEEVIHALDISQREMDVLQLMADGLSNQEIADKLFISIHTVKTHSSNLFSKLQVKRRTQAVQKSKEIGLLSQ